MPVNSLAPEWKRKIANMAAFKNKPTDKITFWLNRPHQQTIYNIILTLIYTSTQAMNPDLYIWLVWPR